MFVFFHFVCIYTVCVCVCVCACACARARARARVRVRVRWCFSETYLVPKVFSSLCDVLLSYVECFLARTSPDA